MPGLFARILNRLSYRRWAKKYAHNFLVILMKRYGWSDYYTSGQISTTIRDAGFNPTHQDIPFAMFAKEIDFNKIGDVERSNYEELRKNLASKYFPLHDYYAAPGNFFTNQESWEKGLSDHVPDYNDMKWAVPGGQYV